MAKTLNKISQGLAKTRPAMTIIVQQAYYIGRGPTTEKVWSCST